MARTRHQDVRGISKWTYRLVRHSFTFPAVRILICLRPEKHERIREWVSPRECLAGIQAWTQDPTTSEDIIAQGGVVIESAKSGKKSSSAKREKKSGAMELALRQFVDLYGWDKDGVASR
jgi:hypothetical protein